MYIHHGHGNSKGIPDESANTARDHVWETCVKLPAGSVSSGPAFANAHDGTVNTCSFLFAASDYDIDYGCGVPNHKRAHLIAKIKMASTTTSDYNDNVTVNNMAIPNGNEQRRIQETTCQAAPTHRHQLLQQVQRSQQYCACPRPQRSLRTDHRTQLHVCHLK